MKRRQVFGSIAGAGTAAIAGANITAAQEDSDLESRVTELEDQMATVLARLDALESTSTTDDPDGESDSIDGSEPITGTGDGTSADFSLEADRYEVTVSAIYAGDSFNFSVWIYAPDDSRELLVNEVIETDFEVETIYEAPVDGDYFLEVTAGSDWSVSITPR